MKGDEFFFEQTETWSNDEFDSKHPLKYTVTPPVMPEKIKVSGSQWIEPHLTGSKLGFRLEVSVGIFGIGGQIASGVMKGTIESFEKVPGRAVEYVKAHGEVDAALEEEKTLGHTPAVVHKLAVARWHLAIKMVINTNRWKKTGATLPAAVVAEAVGTAAVAVVEHSAEVMQKFARRRQSTKTSEVKRQATGMSKLSRVESFKTGEIPVPVPSPEKKGAGTAVPARVAPIEEEPDVVRVSARMPTRKGAGASRPNAATSSSSLGLSGGGDVSVLMSKLDALERRLDTMEQRTGPQSISLKIDEPVKLAGCCSIM